MGRKLVEEPPLGDFLERGQFIANQFRHQPLEAAIRQAAEFKRCLERQLRGGDGVIAGRLDHDAQRIQKHGLKGKIVGNLDDHGIHPQLIPQIVDNFSGVSIAAVEMLKRDIDTGAFFN